MYNVDVSLIKIINNHYWIKRDKIVNKINYKGRLFFDKYERIDKMMTRTIMNEYDDGKSIIAHSLVNAHDKVENIVFDYNGRNTEKFWHRLQLLLREEGYLNFTAYESKTPGHLHVYIHKGHTTFNEGCQIAKNLSAKLALKLPREWKMFPNADIPKEFNILNLPKKVYAKERGSSWARHM